MLKRERKDKGAAQAARKNVRGSEGKVSVQERRD